MGNNRVRAYIRAVSGALSQSIVDGGGGSSLTTSQTEKLGATSGSLTMGVTFPLNAGIRPSARGTVSSWNNNLSAIKFSFDPSPTTSKDGWWLLNFSPQFSGYITGSAVVARVSYSLTGSGYVGSKVRMGIGYRAFAGGQGFQGETNPYTDIYTNVDVENVLYDTFQSFDVTIPAAAWSPTADICFLRLERQQSDSADTYPGAFYVHRLELRYQGYGFAVNLDPQS